MNQQTFYTNFYSKYVGKKIDIDNSYGVQCVDLSKQYMYDLGWSKALQPLGGSGYAKEYWNRRTALGMNEIFDYVTSNFQIGDMIVYKEYAVYTPVSHVGFYHGKSTKAGYHQCFGQNQGGAGGAGNVISLPDAAILGGFRIKQSVLNNQATIPSGWNANGIVKVGSTVRSQELPIQGINAKTGQIQVNDLGGWIPASDLTKVENSDGYSGQTIYNTKAKVYLSPVKVTAINTAKNLCQVNGYWVSCTPLWVKV